MAKITSQGIEKTDFSEILNSLHDDWRAIFSENLDLDIETPQGQITSQIALMLSKVEDVIVDVGRSVDISQSEQQQLDDLTSLLGVFRKKSIHSTVAAVASGTAGIYIPELSEALSVDGDVFVIAEGVTLDENGLAPCSFVAKNAGAIFVDAHELAVIGTPVVGWDLIDNSSTSVVGRNDETDPELTRRYYDELFSNALSILDSISSNISRMDSTISTSAVENCTHEFAGVKGIAIAPHGFVVSVESGESNEVIAQAIMEKRSIGSCPITFIQVAIVGTAGLVIPYKTEFTISDTVNLAGGEVTLTLLKEVTLDGSGDGIGQLICMTSDDVEVLYGESISTAFAGVTSSTAVINPVISTIGIYATDRYKFSSYIIDVYDYAKTFITQQIPIHFVRVHLVPVFVAMDLTDVTDKFPDNGVELIKQSIVDYFTGSNNFTEAFELDGIKTAENVNKTRLMTPINMVQGFRVENLYMSDTAIPDAGNDSDVINMKIFERGTIAEVNIDVSVS